MTERCATGDAAGGEVREPLVFASSSIGKGTFKEPNESCLICCGLPPNGMFGDENDAKGVLPVTCFAFSALSALKSISKGESWCRGGIGIGAREGEGVGEEPESEPSSGGGVGGLCRAFAGTDLDKNLGIGRADAAGDC